MTITHDTVQKRRNLSNLTGIPSDIDKAVSRETV